MMKRAASLPLALCLLLTAVPSLAESPAPAASLMLAAIVAQHSPLLDAAEKAEIAALANGDLAAHWVDRITVDAAVLKCRISDIAITSRSCELRFGNRSVRLHGRNANTLYATLLEAGLRPQGAAGSIYLWNAPLN